MADAADIAQRNREVYLQASLRARVENPEGEQIKRDGEVICRECGDIIPPERLEVRPHATLCVYCKSAMETNPR